MSLLQRLHHFFIKPVVEPPVAELYAACVDQARQVEFYQDLQVADTIDGRFDLLLLHVFLLMYRLHEAGALKQQLFDLMFADMDRNLREMGVGDMSVGKKIRPMISAFYGRGKAYQKALGESDGALAATLGRNLYGNRQVSPEILQHMTSYVRRAAASLENQNLADIMNGKVTFAEPLFK